MKRTIFIIIFIAIVAGISVFFSGFFDNKIDLTPSDKSNIIVVTFPIKNSEISLKLI